MEIRLQQRMYCEYSKSTNIANHQCYISTIRKSTVYIVKPTVKNAKAYLESCQTSKMECFAKIAKG